jgi:transcriptional regulator with XRE-family HTH domain
MESDLTTRIARESQVLGRALLILRARTGMAQQDVAARAGTNAAALSHAEKGQRDFRWSTIARVLDALGADLHDFARAMAEAEKDNSAAPKR